MVLCIIANDYQKTLPTQKNGALCVAPCLFAHARWLECCLLITPTIKVFHMTTSIIGLFESSDIASKVLGELTKAGFKKDTVEIIEKVAASRITSRLVEAGYEKDK